MWSVPLVERPVSSLSSLSLFSFGRKNTSTCCPSLRRRRRDDANEQVDGGMGLKIGTAGGISTRTRQTTAAVVSMVVPPALLKAAQAAATRGLPGRLMLQAARKGGFSLAPALNNVLLLYSIGISIWAAWKTLQTETKDGKDAGAGLDAQGSKTVVEGRAERESSDSQAAEGICPLCDGRGTITYEAKFLWRDSPCPLCLGKGHVRKKKAETLSVKERP